MFSAFFGHHMQIDRISYTGVTAIHGGLERLDKAANAIAKVPAQSASSDTANRDSLTLTNALVQLERTQLEVDSGAKIIKAYDEILGTLLDVEA